MSLKDKEAYRAYMKKYMADRWGKRRSSAIEQLGGKCVSCGSIENLQFDHKDSKDKSFALSKNPSMKESVWQEELQKCQLLCESCHIEKSVVSGDLDNRFKETACDCGKVFDNIKAYSGHKRWCKI